jgi:hypothetical protein
MTDEQRETAAEDGLYPVTFLDQALRTGLGSNAPTPLNPETARKYSQVGPQTIEQKTEEWAREAEEATGQVVPQSVRDLYHAKKRYGKIQSEIRRRENTDDLTGAQLLEAKMRTLAELYPRYERDLPRWLAQIQGQTEGKVIDDLNDQFGKYLGWPMLNQYEAAIERAEKAHAK